MPETPDFERIANRICEAIESPGRSIVEVGDLVAEQLRLIWNARGAADIHAVEAQARWVYLEANRTGREDLVVDPAKAIRELDR